MLQKKILCKNNDLFENTLIEIFTAISCISENNLNLFKEYDFTNLLDISRFKKMLLKNIEIFHFKTFFHTINTLPNNIIKKSSKFFFYFFKFF